MENFSFNTFLELVLRHPRLAKQGTEKFYKKGSHIFNQGEVCRDVFCMQSGLIKLYFSTIEDKEWVKSFIADQGIFGSRSSQSLGKPNTCLALCLEDTEIISFSYDIFEEACSGIWNLPESYFVSHSGWV